MKLKLRVRSPISSLRSTGRLWSRSPAATLRAAVTTLWMGPVYHMDRKVERRIPIAKTARAARMRFVVLRRIVSCRFSTLIWRWM